MPSLEFPTDAQRNESIPEIYFKPFTASPLEHCCEESKLDVKVDFVTLKDTEVRSSPQSTPKTPVSLRFKPITFFDDEQSAVMTDLIGPIRPGGIDIANFVPS